MLRHTITEKDHVLKWTKTKEKKIIIRGGKLQKKKSKRQRKSVRLRMSERKKK